MYQRHFGFKERPFRLVPDPAYLFMGRSHREALAHLTHAVQSGEGFATVIGEVGTGKTTLCRALLEGLDDGVASAYVFNPPVDSLELMRAVNRDFGLDPAPGDALQDG
jgi:general secretion pathway protein A